MRKFLVGMAMLVLVVALAACQQKSDTVAKEPVVRLDGGQLTLDELGKTQPGLGVLMISIGNRYTTAYYAAQAGKWEIVNYEIKELKEDFEVGVLTRPKRKDAIEKFINGSALADLEAAATDEDMAAFNTAFDNTVEVCNACHVGQDVGFIEYKLPGASPAPLSLE